MTCDVRAVVCVLRRCGWWAVLGSTSTCRLSIYFTLCCPHPILVPSNFKLTTSFSKPFRLITWPKKWSCLCRFVLSNTIGCTPAARDVSDDHTLHREPSMRRYTDPRQFCWKYLLQLPAPDYWTVYHHTWEMWTITVYSLFRLVTKLDIFIWTVGP